MPQLATDKNFNARSLEVRASTINQELRQVQATLSTETPVPMYDYGRGEMVPEVLLTSGMQFPKSRQVPMLDSHQRHSTDMQVGSVREIAREDSTSVGLLTFAEGRQWEMVRDGHITDVSVGYEIQKRVFVESGKTKEIGGRSFTGPVNVVTKWRLREVSITPIGADELAKMRGYAPAQEKEQFMDEKLRGVCVSLGMPIDATDEAAREWLVANLEAVNKRNAEQPQTPAVDVNKLVAEAVRKELERKEAEATAFRSRVDELLEVAGISDSGVAARCYAATSVAKVREIIKEENAREDVIITAGPAQRDKHFGAIETALNLRAIESTGIGAAKVAERLPESKRNAGYQDYRHAGLLEMARASLEMNGIKTRGLSREQIALAALGFTRQAGIRSDAGYHQTGNFVNLTLDAVNKTMAIGYMETPTTWQICFRQGSSVQDFKQKHVVKMGAIGNIPIWPGIEAPNKVSFADSKESYAVECRSATISFGYKLLVNDDMDSLTRVPQMFGAAMARTVNAAAWAQITGNPTMSDSVALFAAATGARKRTNLTTGAGAPSVATVQTLSNLMRQMRGENTPEGNESDDILNLQPRFIAGPSALETTINQLVNSAYDPAATSSVNNMVYNPTRVLTPVIEPLLDTSSTTAWYLFAGTSQIDTVEVSFLQGQESPAVRDWVDEETLAQNFTVLQTFAAKAINHRGMQKHAGA